MKNSLLIFALSLAPLASAPAQQKVDIQRGSTPTVSVRLGGAISSVKVIAWAHDSVSITGALGSGSRMDGGPSRVAGPIQGLKFFVEAADDAALRGNILELRVP